MSEAATLFVLALLYNVGKSGAHATRYQSWARKPLIEGLPLSDLYHAFSGIQWLLVLAACLHTWGLDLTWWVPAVLAWGTVWPLSKTLKGLTLRQAMHEAWYVQISKSLWRRTPMRIKKLLKVAAKFTGVVKRDGDTGEPVGARKRRLAASALVVALLVDRGMDSGLAVALVDFLLTLVP